MEIFKNTKFDFLGKKWPCLIVSLVLVIVSVAILTTKGPVYGIDFRGGALMTVQFAGQPPLEKIRSAMSNGIKGEVSVQNFTGANARNQVEIGTEMASEDQLAKNRQAMEEILAKTFGNPQPGKLDFNNSGRAEVVAVLQEALARNNVPMNEQQLADLVAAMKDRANTAHSGLLTNFNQLSGVPGVNTGVLKSLDEVCYLAPYAVKSVESVGPKVGAELRKKAVLATLYALGGMLVYIAFRFEWIYGLGAVIAVFHDTVVTVGVFALLGKEISMTVIAALLTLVGYSMNDTIVIFDRIRENLKLSRREPLEAVMNNSINQTLSRTIMTSGLTLLTALALLIWGGRVLHGFAFALVFGIIIGTYSSVFIASPIVLFWHNRADKRRKEVSAASAARAVDAARKSPTKAVK
jgi:preprotein translocase subunit SecF